MKTHSPLLIFATVTAVGVFGSLEAFRLPFWILMGLALALVVCRMVWTSGAWSGSTWSGRMLVAGAVLLGLGYGVLLPLCQAGVVVTDACGGEAHGHSAAEELRAAAWLLAKQVTMNGGWLLLGLGMALNVRFLSAANPRTLANP